MSLYETIMTRKSVRTYDGRPLSEEDLNTLKQYADNIENPFGIPVRFVFMDAAEYGLSSPVLVGEKTYAAGIVKKGPNAEAAYGYSFEDLVLKAWEMGIGTLWIGGTMKREHFEQVSGKKEDEMMICVTPLGYPAKSRSMREKLMRKGVKADDRKAIGEIFFEGSFDTPITQESIDELGKVCEMVQWAPSAVNKQPWRILKKDGAFYFYEMKEGGRFEHEAVGDLQKTDVGIALCHFVKGAEDLGKTVKVTVNDPGFDVPEGLVYIATVQLV